MYETLKLLLLSVHDKFLLENIIHFVSNQHRSDGKDDEPLLLPIKMQTRYNIFNLTLFYFCNKVNVDHEITMSITVSSTTFNYSATALLLRGDQFLWSMKNWKVAV